MLKIERKACIKCWDIEIEWGGLEVLHMPFAESAENDCYVRFDCSNDHYEDLKYLYYKVWDGYENGQMRAKEEMKLWEKLHEIGFGINDEVLIFISWERRIKL